MISFSVFWLDRASNERGVCMWRRRRRGEKHAKTSLVHCIILGQLTEVAWKSLVEFNCRSRQDPIPLESHIFIECHYHWTSPSLIYSINTTKRYFLRKQVIFLKMKTIFIIQPALRSTFNLENYNYVVLEPSNRGWSKKIWWKEIVFDRNPFLFHMLTSSFIVLGI